MDADFKKRQLVSYEQMTALLEFLQEHPDLAKGLTRGRRGRHLSLRQWDLCAKKLNTIKDAATRDGALKNGRGWSKYWCDWKYRVRRKALELKAAKEDNHQPSEGVVPLSDIEQSIINLIGESTVDGIVIKNDPLADENSEEEDIGNEQNNEESTSQNQCAKKPKPRRGQKRRRPPSRELSDFEDVGESSSPPERKPRTSAANSEHEDSGDDEASRFLRLEKQSLETSARLLTCVQTIAAEMTRLVDVLSHIRDVLINNRNVI